MKITKNNISYFESGDKSKQPVIFVHGFPFDHTMWDDTVNELSREYYCITFDIRGLGTTPTGDGQYTIEMFVDDIEELISELNLNKPVLCGLSMGGYISCRAIERMEEMFGGLILCDTKSFADTNDAKFKRAAGIKKINEEGSAPFAQDFLQALFTDEYKKSFEGKYKRILENSMKKDPVGVKGCLLAMAGRTDTTSYLLKIKLPVLVVCGEEDKLITPEAMKKMADKISGSEFVVVPGAAHMTPIENPDRFNSTLKKFLEKNF